MVCWLITVTTFVAVVLGALGAHLDPCPRHRGLPDGLKRVENRIGDRALYKLDLRSALKGYIPKQIYRLRVHTTSKKFKFNDATLVVDGLDSKCGAGSLIVDTDELYSPKDCPDVVTTQQKDPMGRAHFKWQAPSCGCVHIRVQVHANTSYFLEDESTQNGPLARTICPRGNVDSAPPRTTETQSHVHGFIREERLTRLCEESRSHTTDDLLKNNDFSSRRVVNIVSEFDKEQLHIALEQRKSSIHECCSKGHEMLECFGDVRRRRIDAFCGTGEPDIPFSKARLDWIKQKETECCWQIGEDRYTCFNYTLYEETMLRDGRIDETQINKIDLDDFDPANDIDDYHSTDELEEIYKKPRRVNEMLVEDSINNDLSTEQKYDITEDLEHKNIVKEEKNDVEDDVDEEEEDEEDSSKIESITGDEALSSEECCLHGITVGTQVASEGVDGCFRMADKFNSLFTNMSRTCDRRFVVCCMRVVDGNVCVRRSKSKQYVYETLFRKQTKGKDKNQKTNPILLKYFKASNSKRLDYGIMIQRTKETPVSVNHLNNTTLPMNTKLMSLNLKRRNMDKRKRENMITKYQTWYNGNHG